MAKGTIFSFERYEKKYFLTEAEAHRLLGIMGQHLDPDAYGEYTVCNIYYDTDDWRIISASCEKPDYKEKLRVRSYGVPEKEGNVFAELKKKCSGIVYKRRIVTAADEVSAFLNRTDLTGTQIENEIMWFQKFHKTHPKVFIGYDRTAFSGKYDPGLRITFDRNIRFRTDRLDLRLGDDGTRLNTNGLVLMEIKIPGVCPLWLSEILSENSVFPTSFSKYGAFYKEQILKVSPAAAEPQKKEMQISA